MKKLILLSLLLSGSLLAGDHVMDNLQDGFSMRLPRSLANRKEYKEPKDCLAMQLPESILGSGHYRSPSWRPQPVLKVGDYVPHEINGVRFEFIVVRVFWDGKIWRYVTRPDNRIAL